MTEIELVKLDAFALKPGETLVVKFTEDVGLARFQRLYRQIKHQLPDNGLAFLPKECEVARVREEVEE